MLTSAYVCSPMLTYAHLCSPMQSDVSAKTGVENLRMLTYADEPTYAHVCSRMPRPAVGRREREDIS